MGLTCVARRDCGVWPNPESKCQDGYQGEAGRLQQHAGGVTKVLHILLRAQGNDGIDARSSPCRYQAGTERDESQ